MKLEDIIKDVKSELSEKRFEHSIGVMERAEVLANIYGLDVEKAKKVGIAHDIAKEIPTDKKFKYIEENNIKIDEIEKNNPALLHGKIGADIAKKRYEFDESMQKAILYHTTGHEDMDLLAKIIYVADKTEKTRKYKGELLKEEQKMSEEDIDKTMIYLINNAIKKNIDRNNLIDPNSILIRNKLMIIKSQKNN